MLFLFHGGDAFPGICGFGIIILMFIVLAVWLTAQFTGGLESGGDKANPLSLLSEDDERPSHGQKR